MELKKAGAIFLALGVLIGWFGTAYGGAGGTITGTVKFAGNPPAPKKMAIEKDKAKCGTETLSQSLVVGPEKGVRWAVVSLDRGKMGKPSKAPEIDQKGCNFVPRVVVVPTGEKLTIFNSDKILHNIHTYSAANPPLNKPHPKFRKKLWVKFKKPEIIKLNCDVHTWMLGWIVVADTPTAVTDQKGTFTLENVPAGDYKLQVWHEKLGKQVKTVKVKAGGVTKISLVLGSD